MKTTLTIVFTCFIISVCGQTNDSAKVIRKTFDIYNELRKMQKEAEIDILTYLDSTFNYQVLIPNWLNLKETGMIYAWGGTLPAVEGIENAIMITACEKNEYKSFVEFRKYIVEDLIFGQKMPWSDSHIFYGKKELGKYKNIGYAYKVYCIYQNLMYHCKYILVETKTAYLWINFTSTPETFEKNINKFDEFMNGFKITNF